MKLSRWMTFYLLASLAWLAGSSCTVGYSDYGIVVPLLPHDPSLLLEDFSYTPASPIHVGDTLSFSAKTNHATNAGSLGVQIGIPGPGTPWVYLNDEGAAPDDIAGDGLWHGSLLWEAQLGLAEGLPVIAELSWADGAKGQDLDGPPLTVLPAQEGQ